MDGYAPIGAYLGNEGWCVGLELRDGRTHSAQDTDQVLERVLPRAARLTAEAVLVRMDSGFDSGKLFGAIAAASAERQREGGVPIEALIKWNPRGGGAEAVIERALADEGLAWQHPREGKRTTLFEDTLERRGGDGQPIGLRRVLSVTERTIDRHGQHLLMPRYEVHGYLTTLDAETADAETVTALYRDHATHEPFHSEIKTDLDLERLPSGKFATNDLVCSLAALAYNVLRLIGQNALTGDDAPPRHAAKRRRLRTVIQEMMWLAAAVAHYARASACSSSAPTARRSRLLSACIDNGERTVTERPRAAATPLAMPHAAGRGAPVPRWPQRPKRGRRECSGPVTGASNSAKRSVQASVGAYRWP